MSASCYDQLALGWQPERGDDRQFKLIAAATVVAMLSMAAVLSLIPVPEKEPYVRPPVPPRIANFVMQREQAKPPPPPEPVIEKKVEPPKPLAPPEVKRVPKRKQERAPLTESQKSAREKAAQSGLLALGNELADLMDTSAVNAMVSGDVVSGSATAARAEAAGFDEQTMLAEAGKGSEGVSGSRHGTVVANTRLKQRELTQVQQTLVAAVDDEPDEGAGKGRGRAEEAISIVFDRNKSKLYSVYNRSLRRQPGLKGRIVFELTIAPSGKVIAIKVVSSELNNPKLERQLISRIKQFDFGASDADQVVVTYPIEFLPS